MRKGHNPSGLRPQILEPRIAASVVEFCVNNNIQIVRLAYEEPSRALCRKRSLGASDLMSACCYLRCSSHPSSVGCTVSHTPVLPNISFNPRSTEFDTISMGDAIATSIPQEMVDAIAAQLYADEDWRTLGSFGLVQTAWLPPSRRISFLMCR